MQRAIGQCWEDFGERRAERQRNIIGDASRPATVIGSGISGMPAALVCGEGCKRLTDSPSEVTAIEYFTQSPYPTAK